MAKKAVDSTVKKIMVYTAEIIASFILLVIICLPLAFTIPMWVQKVFLGSPTSEYLINPVAWFGLGGAIGATILLAIPSLIFGFLTIMKMTPSGSEADDSEETEEDEEESEEEEFDEEVSAEIDDFETVEEIPDTSEDVSEEE